MAAWTCCDELKRARAAGGDGRSLRARMITIARAAPFNAFVLAIDGIHVAVSYRFTMSDGRVSVFGQSQVTPPPASC